MTLGEIWMTCSCDVSRPLGVTSFWQMIAAAKEAQEREKDRGEGYKKEDQDDAMIYIARRPRVSSTESFSR